MISDVIYLEYKIRVLEYNDTDISVIFHKINDTTIIIESITLDNKFISYILMINNSVYCIYSQNQIITLKIPLHIRNNIAETTIIPKVIIHTWESKDIDNSAIGYPKRVIQRMNPEYKYIIFDVDDRRHFLVDNYDDRIVRAYDKLKPKAYQCDLWRYCYLYKNGGIYIDIKSIPIMPFAYILDKDYEMIIAIEQGGKGIFNGIMASAPGNAYFKLLIDDCIEKIENNYYGESPLDITGPNLCAINFNKYKNIKKGELIKPEFSNYKYLNLINNKLEDAITGINYFHRTFSTYYTIFNKLDNKYYGNAWTNRDVYKE